MALAVAVAGGSLLVLGRIPLQTLLGPNAPFIMAWPGILAGSLLAFARAMGEFGASLMVAGSIPNQTQTLSMAIYDSVQAGEDDRALLLVIVTSLVSVAVLLFSNRLFTLR